MPSYHDIYVTTKDIPRTSIFDLPYGYEITCTRVTGWHLRDPQGVLIGGEFDFLPLKLEVNEHVIVDSFENSGDEE